MATLEDRVAALEQDLATVRDRLDMEAGLAASRDRDVSEVKQAQRQHTRTLNALRQTQVEQGQVLAEHTVQLAELHAGQEAIVGMLSTLIERTEPTHDEPDAQT
jgi:hypothetical protein